MNPYLLDRSEDNEFFTEEQCHILELLNNNTDAPFSVARARVEPGITTRWHKLIDTDEYYVILKGHGKMGIGKFPAFEVHEGDIIRIPKNVRQRITNLSLESDLLFYAICSPAFKNANYVDLQG